MFTQLCLVSRVVDFLPRLQKGSTKANLPWLVRRVEVSFSSGLVLI